LKPARDGDNKIWEKNVFVCSVDDVYWEKSAKFDCRRITASFVIFQLLMNRGKEDPGTCTMRRAAVPFKSQREQSAMLP